MKTKSIYVLLLLLVIIIVVAIWLYFKNTNIPVEFNNSNVIDESVDVPTF